MRIEIDIDQEKARTPLTWREKFGVRILLTVFAMVYPVRYPHQLKELMQGIFEGEK